MIVGAIRKFMCLFLLLILTMHDLVSVWFEGRGGGALSGCVGYGGGAR